MSHRVILYLLWRLAYNGIFVWGSDLVTSHHWPEQRTFDAGVFLMSGGWEEAHLVYLPYCSSDAHMGDTEMVTSIYGMIQV